MSLILKFIKMLNCSKITGFTFSIQRQAGEGEGGEMTQTLYAHMNKNK
jgi:hypothetical protein